MTARRVITPWTLALWSLTLVYPLLVYVSLTRFQPRYMVLLLIAIALARLGSGRRDVLAQRTPVPAGQFAHLRHVTVHLGQGGVRR